MSSPATVRWTPLADFEAFLLDWLPNPSAAADRSARDLVTRAIAYLGETLMWVGGGQWVWSTRDLAAMRCVAFDVELGLEPLAPLRVINEAVRVRDGREFDRALALLEAALALRRVDDPEWAPTKDATPGLDSVPQGTPHPELLTWLAEGEAAFASLLADRGRWDFSAQSPDRLEALTRERIVAPDDADNPQHHTFLQAAAWYLGETIRRHKDAQWAYLPGELDEYNQWIGRPCVKPYFRDGHAEVLLVAVRLMLRHVEPGIKRDRLACAIKETIPHAHTRHRRDTGDHSSPQPA